jgi:tetratricopeptide (TPR) repeat protein
MSFRPFRAPWPSAVVPVVACAALVVALTGVARAQAGRGGADEPGIVEDDPFADELNPFGKQPQAAPGGATPPAAAAPPPGRLPTKPPIQLPVPFPESTVPGEPAPRREPRPATTAPRRDYRLPRDETETWEPTESEKLVAEAEKLDTAGDLAGAKAKLQEALRIDPKLTIGWLALGVVSRRLGDFEGSVDACSKGISIDPNVAELYLRRGIAWYHMGLYGIALEDFEEAAGMGYDDPRPELWRGLTLIELDRPLEAINAYAASIRRDRDFMLAYLNRGLAYLSTGEPRKAEFDFDMAIRRDPRDARAWFNRGVAQARQGRFAEAVKSYAAALERDPRMEEARRNLAAAQSMAGRK